MNTFNWDCPFCNRPQTVGTNASIDYVVLGPQGSKHGLVACKVASVACSNPECLELFLNANIVRAELEYGKYSPTEDGIFHLGSRPQSSNVPQPDYIPNVLRQDYYEACAIVDLSPKASATLSRRCLQGMIRDFCGISKNQLVQEIAELKRRSDAGDAPAGVQPDIIDAIDAIRKIGNIGAHMERDINVIVDVDPDEAKTLIELLELLFKEWYVARYTRGQRIAAISAIAALKEAQKALPQSAKQHQSPGH